jgi:PEP-CTERM/exosortase A-associated glycosyltransferase
VRILHVLDHSIPLHSGYTFRTRAILREQHARGWETVQITGPKHGPSTLAVEDVDGLRFHRTLAAGGPLDTMPVLGQVRVVSALRARLAEVIAASSPDIVHAHSPALNGLAALHAARRAHLPVVYECRAFWEDAAVDLGTSRAGGARYRLTRALESHVFRRADAVTTICEGLRADIAARGIAAEKITVIPNAVDLEHFPYAAPVDPALRERLGLGDGPVLGFIGSFYAYEGLDVLIDALPALCAHDPGLRVLLVGGGNEAKALQARCARLGVADRVIFVGRVPHAEVAAYYSLVDLFVYPRKSMRLTELVTPLKPLEAMAQGKLVIASDVGGHRELVDPGRTGFLFRAGDAQALAAQLIDTLSRRDEWHAVRQRARSFVERERTWAASVARYEAVYAAVRRR